MRQSLRQSRPKSLKPRSFGRGFLFRRLVFDSHGALAERKTSAPCGRKFAPSLRIDHAFGTEALLQTNRGAKDPAIDADILAEQYHARIMRHFVGERSIDRFDQIDLSHHALQWPARSAAPSHAAHASRRGAAHTNDRTWLRWLGPASRGSRQPPG